MLRIAADSEQDLEVSRLEDEEQHEWSVNMEQEKRKKKLQLYLDR